MDFNSSVWDDHRLVPRNNEDGDGAVLKYNDACGNVEQGLKEMLERIYGHLDNFYDEMMARSLKRRAVFLSECIQAEIVRQADLMLQLSRLDEVLQRKLTRMRAECLDGSASPEQSSPVNEEGDTGYQDEQIEDCDEALEQQRICLGERNRPENTPKTIKTESADDLASKGEPFAESKPSTAKNDVETKKFEASGDKANKKVSEKEIPRQTSDNQTARVEFRQNRLSKTECAAPPPVAMGQEKVQPQVGVPGQTGYTPVYISPSSLTYAYANPSNVMYLGKTGTTVDATQIAAALQSHLPAMAAATANNQTTTPYTILPVVGTTDTTHSYATLTTPTAYTNSMASPSYPTVMASTEHQYADAKTHTFNLNGVPVNGLLFNLPEQTTVPTMNHMGVLTGSGDSSTTHCLPLMNAAYLGQQQQQQQHHYQYNQQPIQVQPQQSYQPYHGYPMYGYYPGYY